MAPDRYVLGDAYKGGLGSVLSIPRGGGDGDPEGIRGVHAMYEVWCEVHQHKSSNNRELINLVEMVEEEVDARSMYGI